MFRPGDTDIEIERASNRDLKEEREGKVERA